MIPRRHLAAAFITGCALVLLANTRTMNDYDEGIILDGALMISHGYWPHRDFYADYGPGQFALLAMLFKIFGPHFLLLRLLDAGWRGLSALMVYILARGQGAAPPAAGIAWGLATAFLAMVGFYGYPLYPVLALTLVATWLLNTLFSARPVPHAAMLAGACAGLAGLFRYDLGLALCGLHGGFLLAAWRLRAPGFSRGAAALNRWCAGVAAILVPAVLGFAAAGMLRGWAADIPGFAIPFYAAQRRLPPPGLAAILADPVQALVFLPPLVLAAYWLLPGVPGGVWRRAPLSMAAGLFIAKGAVRISPVHLSGGIVISLICLAIMMSPGPRRRWRWAAGVSAALAFCLPVWVFLARLSGNIAWLAQGAPGPVPSLPPDMRHAIEWVSAHTAADQHIYVGQPAHDRVFANDMAFYFLARRLPATHWYYFVPDLQNTAAIQSRMIAEFEATPPPVVVLEPRWRSTEPNDSAKSSGVTLLDAWLAARYTPAASFGRFTIERPK